MKRYPMVFAMTVVLTVLLLANAGLAQTFFQFSELQAPALVKQGNALPVSAAVQNIGGREGTAYVNLFVDGILADTKEVVLQPGEKTTVEFSVSFSRLGMHEVSIGNLTPLKVKYYDNPLDSALLILDFNEGEGNVVYDASGFDNHGYFVGNPQWVEGVEGTGVRTADYGYIDIPLSPSLDVSGQTLTMAIWFRPMDEQGYSDFFTQGDHNVLKMQTPTELNFFAGGWARGECMAEVADDWNDNWHFVVGVADHSELRLYIDGELVQTLSVDGEIEPNPYNWNIGRNAQAPTGRETNGFLDGARIYAEALTIDEIRTIMNSYLQ